LKQERADEFGHHTLDGLMSDGSGHC
jgi:hypothetical protein